MKILLGSLVLTVCMAGFIGWQINFEILINPALFAMKSHVSTEKLHTQNVAPDDSAAAATGPDTPESRSRGHLLKTVAFEDAACSTAEPDPAPPPQKKTNVSDAKKRPEIFSQKQTRLSSSSTANARKSQRDCEVFEKRVSLEIPTTRLSN